MSSQRHTTRNTWTTPPAILPAVRHPPNQSGSPYPSLHCTWSPTRVATLQTQLSNRQAQINILPCPPTLKPPQAPVSPLLTTNTSKARQQPSTYNTPSTTPLHLPPGPLELVALTHLPQVHGDKSEKKSLTPKTQPSNMEQPSLGAQTNSLGVAPQGMKVTHSHVHKITLLTWKNTPFAQNTKPQLGWLCLTPVTTNARINGRNLQTITDTVAKTPSADDESDPEAPSI